MPEGVRQTVTTRDYDNPVTGYFIIARTLDFIARTFLDSKSPFLLVCRKLDFWYRLARPVNPAVDVDILGHDHKSETAVKVDFEAILSRGSLHRLTRAKVQNRAKKKNA